MAANFPTVFLLFLTVSVNGYCSVKAAAETKVKRQVACGGTIRGTSGTLTSPNFPNNYPNDATCTWTLRGPPGTKRIDITFPSLDIEWGSTCEWDYLIVKDKAGNQVGPRFCGRPDNPKASVPGDIVIVFFKSDDAANEKGFKATFVAIAPPKPPAKGDCNFDQGLCSGWENIARQDTFDWTVLSGSTPTMLTGPSADHSGNGKYVYIESTGKRKGAKARLATAKISGPRCLKFFYHMYGIVGMGTLRVYVLTSNRERLVMSLTGDQGNQWKSAYLQIDETVPYKVVFEGTVGQSDYSDIAIDDVTFSASSCPKTGSGCVGVLTDSRGVFASPKFPDSYPDNSRCTWVIRPSTQTSLIVIQFKSFRVEMEPMCRDDYVTVRDQQGTPVQQARFCGFYNEGFGLKVHGQEATVTFHSNGHLRGKGFSATYQSIPTTSGDDCDFDSGLCSAWHNAQGDDFDWSVGKEMSPSFFTGPYRDVYVLGAYAFIESSHRQPGDKALLVSGLISGAKCLSFSYNMRGRHMGTLRVLVMAKKGTRMLWRSAGDHGRGWLKDSVNLNEGSLYQVIFEGVVGESFTSDMALDEISFTDGQCPPKTACDHVLTDAAGLFTSPNYPSLYPSGVNCAWTIIPPPQYANIVITFHDVDLENSMQCSKDYVMVEDITGTQIEHKICGSEGQANRTLTLNWHKAKVHFHSDGSTAGRGFRASYKATGSMPGCGGQLSGYTGVFQTPNYPHNYPLREICDWEITGPPATKKMTIQFEDFAIDDAAVMCSYNYLIVYDAQHGNEVGKYCGMTKPLPIMIAGNVANIRFHSSHFGAARGFKAHFTAV